MSSQPRTVSRNTYPIVILLLILTLFVGISYCYIIEIPLDSKRLSEKAIKEDSPNEGQIETNASSQIRLKASLAKADQDRLAAPPEEQQKLQAPLKSKRPKAGEVWTDSLGLRFVPAGTIGILFCVYDVRVEDYRQFVQDTGYQMSGGIYTAKLRGGEKSYSFLWELDPEASWEKPGFAQGQDYPVVGVNWDDAEAFCQWLTQKDQKTGALGPNQYYRLPKDQEWSQAVGHGKYPWGDVWPPPESAGNYPIASLKASVSNANWETIPGDDGPALNSPVGSFPANKFGLYDMGGNVWQWCDDWYNASMNSDEVNKKIPGLADDGGGRAYKVLRGASGHGFVPMFFRSACRGRFSPRCRTVFSGFRLVVAVSK